jgi:hypothetical protein
MAACHDKETGLLGFAETLHFGFPTNEISFSRYTAKLTNRVESSYGPFIYNNLILRLMPEVGHILSECPKLDIGHLDERAIIIVHVPHDEIESQNSFW